MRRNNLLKLGLRFEESGFDGKYQETWSNHIIKSDDLNKYIKDLKRLKEYWDKEDILPGVLISVYYNRTIPKTSRITRLFSKDATPSSNYIKGVRFADGDAINKKHIFTYYIDKQTLQMSIERLEKVEILLNRYFDGEMNKENFKKIDTYKRFINEENLNKTLFIILLKDLINIEKFDLYKNEDKISASDYFVTFFETNDAILTEILNKLEIKNTEYKMFSKDTIFVNDLMVLTKIREKAPYLVSMALNNIAEYKFEKCLRDIEEKEIFSIKDPTNEPTIGVIDSLFSKKVYFSKWVTFVDMVNKDLNRSDEDYIHGTEVSSLIVDGARINKEYDDGCGFFKVKHFGILKDGKNNVYDIINKIKLIVEENKDKIHVYNLSFGCGNAEINDNYISMIAAVLDELQNKYNVIFVISGTNKKEGSKAIKIGPPADSINSIVVNSVDKNNNPASYSRKGGVLSFFIKPDVCAFGGDKNCPIRVCAPLGAYDVCGTSFAAPWISRKLSFLIDKMNLSREVAKALIINSAIGWNKTAKNIQYLGYGVVPTKISDILTSKENEIMFYVEGSSKSYKTEFYNLPIPENNNKIPYYAKAVLCSFPKCERNQGVDYTTTDLELSFGRIKNNNLTIIKIDKIIEEGFENVVRNELRKWDNVKILIENSGGKPTPRIKYLEKNYWGIRIGNIGRPKDANPVKFAIVITLKEMFDKNRIREFELLCRNENIPISIVDIDEQLNFYNKMEEKLVLETSNNINELNKDLDLK